MVTAAVLDKTTSHKRSLRNYLLDSSFQLKYAGFLVLVAMAVCGVMGTVLYSTARAVVDESAKVVEEGRKVYDESRKVSEVSGMNIYLASDSPELRADFSKETEAHDRTIAAQQRVIADKQIALIRSQTRMIWSLVGGLAMMVFLVGLFGIYFTHKVAGPIFKMTKLLREVGVGNLAVEARLRKGDELQDFFGAFAQMVAGLRKFEGEQLEELDAAERALSAGRAEDAAAYLGRAREAMKRALAR
jgi:nitrogen fixation/metabolism regulation signal transduction histidine kinase